MGKLGKQHDKNSRQKVLIDSRTNIPYGSFYIKGLMDVFRKKNVKFVSKPFSKLSPLGWNIRFIVRNGNKETKVFIHTNDTYKIELEHYHWCDIYGNVNANYKYYPKEEYPKQISLVPSFAIRNFNLFETVYYSIINFLKTFNDIKQWKAYNKVTKQYDQNSLKNIKRHFKNYLKNYLKRCPLEAYHNKIAVNRNYIFFLSTLWYSDEYNKNDEGVNRRRANFIEVAKEIPDCIFEGGLLTDNSSSSNLFEQSKTNIRLDFPVWLQKTKESELVFNTPAFWDCHGWKLGEYLALGKAIISTPLSNDLPKPLIHGEHIHFIPDSSKKTIREAIVCILENPEYRMQLEKNAQKYWDDFGMPEKALLLLGLNKESKKNKI